MHQSFAMLHSLEYLITKKNYQKYLLKITIKN